VEVKQLILQQKIWHFTGNPFVDMGQEMMSALARVDQPEELSVNTVEPLLSRVVDLYFQPTWNKIIYLIFPNSPLTNPATKNRKQAYLHLLRQWLLLAEQPQSERIPDTACNACGDRAQLCLSRTFVPLADAEGGNFQSHNTSGIPFCGACALALQFMPLGVAKVGGKLALPQFSDAVAQYNWSEWCWKQGLLAETTGAAGPLDAGTARAVNAFFALIERLLRDLADREIPDTSVTLYLFTNYNQGPDVELHYLPTKVFRFIKLAMSPTLQPAWRQLVRRGYVDEPKKLALETLDEAEQLKKRTNSVYEHLLHERSISGFFVDLRRRCAIGNWPLFKTYLQEVYNMDERRLESLRAMGTRIAEIVRNKRKRLLALERTARKGELLEQLYLLSKDAAAAGQKRPLLTFDELVQDVFPQDPEKYESWREIKFLLLFRVYEMLYDELRADAEWTTSDETKEILEEVGG
jgi:CRISPR-associated protein Cst1